MMPLSLMKTLPAGMFGASRSVTARSVLNVRRLRLFTPIKSADAEREAMEKEYGEKMLPIAQRLVVVDPHSASALRLLAASYQLQGQEDSTLAVLERAQALTFDVTVSVFRPVSGGGFEVRGIIINLSDESLTVPAIRFEFVNEAGEVVETAEIPQQTIEPESMAPFQLRPSSEGMAAWRYSSGT